MNQFVRTLVDIGFLSDEEKDFLKPGSKISWKGATAKILGATSQETSDIIWAISSKTTFANTNEKNRIIAGR
jgi:saccharopine dehydrogenase (NADP+, L-glutamate forming)